MTAGGTAAGRALNEPHPLKNTGGSHEKTYNPLYPFPDSAEEAVKDHYYQILDAAGKELYTVTDSGAVAEIDALINKAGGENADHGNAEGDPLYTYVYWQETTLHAGEDPDAEREYLEVFRTQVRQGSNAVTTEVLSDTLEGVGSFVGVEGLGGLLTFTAEVPQETADALRDPAQFAGA